MLRDPLVKRGVVHCRPAELADAAPGKDIDPPPAGWIGDDQLDAAAAISADEYDAARRTASRARQVLADTMTDHDVILTPSAMSFLASASDLASA